MVNFSHFVSRTAVAMQNLRYLKISITAAVLTSCCLGCHVNRDLGPPGDMNTQRTRALVHDPFPANDIAPDIAGIRPRGFDLPRSEIQKLQTNPNAQRGGQVPAEFQYQPGAYGGF